MSVSLPEPSTSLTEVDRRADKVISQKVKQRMIEIEPRGFKYIVTTTLSENLGHAGRSVDISERDGWADEM